MTLLVNSSDLGMNMLPGLVYAYTNGQRLPKDLYVYGIGNHYGVHLCVDPCIPNAEALACTITDKMGFSTIVDVVGTPQKRPALGLARIIREPTNIELTAKAVVMAIYAVNGRVDFSQVLTVPTTFEYLPGDYVIRNSYDVLLVLESKGSVLRVRGSDRVQFTCDVNEVVPCRPQIGKAARLLKPLWVFHPGIGRFLLTTHRRLEVYNVIRGRAYFSLPDGNCFATDINRLIQVY